LPPSTVFISRVPSACPFPKKKTDRLISPSLWGSRRLARRLYTSFPARIRSTSGGGVG
jgi:hypothetical protein